VICIGVSYRRDAGDAACVPGVMQGSTEGVRARLPASMSVGTTPLRSAIGCLRGRVPTLLPSGDSGRWSATGAPMVIAANRSRGGIRLPRRDNDHIVRGRILPGSMPMRGLLTTRVIATSHQQTAEFLGTLRMHGNVWEWCWDCRTVCCTINDRSIGPKKPAANRELAVVRGGSFGDPPVRLRSRFRPSSTPRTGSALRVSVCARLPSALSDL